MSHRNEDEWNESEHQAFQALPRSRQPDGRLEEQTVQRLIGQGLLRRPRPAWWRRPAPAWVSAAAAALLAVFLAGFSLGQQQGAQSTAQALATLQQGDLMRAAARVQQTGSDYVAALNALSLHDSSSRPEQFAQGREVATAALYAAAAEVIRLDPNDPLAVRILQGLEMHQQKSRKPSEQERKVFWF
ncbi:MAG: hypothetical protein V3T83_05455 [Acidobacteriota bacterium]